MHPRLVRHGVCGPTGGKRKEGQNQKKCLESRGPPVTPFATEKRLMMLHVAELRRKK